MFVKVEYAELSSGPVIYTIFKDRKRLWGKMELLKSSYYHNIHEIKTSAVGD
jgi:hypothetical protein